MASLRIAHLADTHLGYRALSKTDPLTGRNQRSEDIERAFVRTIDDLLERDIDLVIHAGDLFQHPRPVFPAISLAIRQFRRLEAAGIPTVVIGGNHDTPRMRASGSVFGLLAVALPDITFAGGYEMIPHPLPELDITLMLMPHGSLTNPEPPIPLPVGSGRNILVTHGLAPSVDLDAVRREPGEEALSDEMLDAGFDYIALGHYHAFHQPAGVANAWYSGATERMGWGDQQNVPGYALVELGDEPKKRTVTHVPLPVRPMEQIDIPAHLSVDDDPEAIAALAIERIAALSEPDAMVRVMLGSVSRTTKRRAESLIQEAGRDLVWSIQVVSRSDQFAGFANSRADLPSIDLLDQFSAFIDQRLASGDYDQAFADAFRETGTAELKHAIEQANEAIGEEVAP